MRSIYFVLALVLLVATTAAAQAPARTGMPGDPAPERQSAMQTDAESGGLEQDESGHEGSTGHQAAEAEEDEGAVRDVPVPDRARQVVAAFEGRFRDVLQPFN